MGNLGAEQLAWLADDLKGKSASTPLVVFAHIPLWTIAPEWGWGTEDSERGAETAGAVRLGDRAQRPYPPAHAEGGRQCRLPHGALYRLSATCARNRAVAGPESRAGGELRGLLGVRSVVYRPGATALAVTDTSLAG